MMSKGEFPPGDINSSDDEIDEEVDGAPVDEDICSQDEIHQLFSVRHRVFCEERICPENTYILGLCSNRSLNHLSAGLSCGSVKIFDITTGLTISERITYPSSESKRNTICGIEYLDETSNELLVGRTDGQIYLYDLRTNAVQHIFQSGGDNEERSILCFDVNANSRIICAGTERNLNDAFVLFFDIRQTKLLGSYSDSHSYDITSVKFHKHLPDSLITGSIDGLINYFDTSQPTEEDALMMTINSESSVQKLNWHIGVNDKSVISCITHTNDLIVCDPVEGEIMSKFKRSEVTQSLKRKSVDDCNLIHCHDADHGSILVIAGSNFHNGETMRSLKVQHKSLVPYGDFEDNKQIVRESIFNQEKNIIITGGEGGIISIWGSRIDQPNISTLKIKTKSDKKLHTNKPYLKQ